MATNQTPSSIAPGSLDAWEYLASYADLRGVYGTDTVGAAQHYTDFGISEGRAITFDAWVYMASHDDLLNFYGSSLDAMGAASHYVIFGAAEGRATNTFDALAYINDPGNTDLLAAFGGDADGGRSNGAEHYVTFGRSEIASGLRDSSGQNTGAGDFVLTAGVDNYPGTLDNSGNDTLTATEATLTAGDNLNGGGGSDALNYWTNTGGNHGAFTMTNVERLQATADLFTTSTFDLSGTTGVTTFASVNTTGNLVFNQVTGLAALEVQNMTTGGNVTIAYQDPVVAGGSDAMSLNLINNYNTGIGTILIGSLSDSDSGIETLNITTSSAGTRVATLDADVTTINITGSQDLEIINPLDDNVATLSAGTMTGDLDLDMRQTLVDVDYYGSQGDDTINFDDDWTDPANGASTNTGLTHDISGGAGHDDIIGGDGDDDIHGEAGDDEISGRGGDDDIEGGDGEDDISGGAGNDEIDGGAGSDELSGGADNDSITGGTGDDDILGGDGNDILRGDAGVDEITGGAGADLITGGAGGDQIDISDAETVEDTVRYNDDGDAGLPGVLEASQGDDVDGFTTTEDKVNFTGDFLFSDMVGANQNAVNAPGYAGGLDFNDNLAGDDTVQLFAAGAATAVIGDLFVGDDLRAAVGTVADETVGQERILIFNSGDGNSAIYRFSSIAADNTIADNELSLLGVVDAVLVAGDVTFTT